MRERQVARDAPEPFDHRGAAAFGDLALDRAPEQVEHLGHHDHARDPMVAQGIEDDPWVPAPDIEHVGADIERVEQRDRLFEQVREGEQRDDPVLHRRHDAVERLDRCDDVVVCQHGRPWACPWYRS